MAECSAGFSEVDPYDLDVADGYEENPVCGSKLR